MQYLSSFKPLNINKRGRQAIESFGLPSYIDCSCRREPDFESKYPSISAICHAGKFAPRLHEEDEIIFMTVKGNYFPIPSRHWRLVAILKVIKRLETHEEAANWYLSHGLPLPSNCIIEENKPLPLEMTTGPIPFSRFKKIKNPDQIISLWDSQYRKRTTEHGVFLVCEPEFLELYQPPILTEDTLKEIFGKIPVTRNPPKISENHLAKIREIIKMANNEN